MLRCLIVFEQRPFSNYSNLRERRMTPLKLQSDMNNFSVIVTKATNSSVHTIVYCLPRSWTVLLVAFE
jgi:hypothetical protein